jgi:hypothetical protein
MLINKTDHVVRIKARTENKRGFQAQAYLELEPSEAPCFVDVRTVTLKNAVEAQAALFVDLVQTVWGEIQNPPPAPAPGVFYVVSTVVARHPALRGRPDILIPAALVIDRSTKTITGCDALQRSPYAEDLQDA